MEQQPTQRRQPSQRQRQVPTTMMFATPAEENPFEREWRAKTETRLDGLERAMHLVEAGVTRIEASMPSRGDVEAAARTRVDVDSYRVAHQALLDRVSRLENGPQRLIGWLAMIVSGGIGCLMVTVASLALLVSAASLIVTLTH